MPRPRLMMVAPGGGPGALRGFFFGEAPFGTGFSLGLGPSPSPSAEEPLVPPDTPLEEGANPAPQSPRNEGPSDVFHMHFMRRLRDQLAIYSFQYKTASNAFSKGRVSLNGLSPLSPLCF